MDRLTLFYAVCILIQGALIRLALKVGKKDEAVVCLSLTMFILIGFIKLFIPFID